MASPLASLNLEDLTDTSAPAYAAEDAPAPGTATAGYAGAGALSALDIPGSEAAMATLARSSEQARAALQQARAKIQARKYNDAIALLSVGSALGAPTRSGTSSEGWSNAAHALIDPLKEKQAFEEKKDTDLLGIDKELWGLDEGTATAQLKLAALRAKLANDAAGQPLEKVVGPDGKPVYKTRMLAREQQAFVPPTASTNISLGIGKTFGDKLADEMAPDVKGQYVTARDAPQALERVADVRALLAKVPYTGAGAEWKLKFGKAAKAVGLDYAGDDIKNTELLFSRLGQETLNNVHASGLGTGNGFTDKDLQFLRQVVGGTITLDSKALSDLADLHERAARLSVSKWNDTYQRLAPKNKDSFDQLGMTPIELQAAAQQAAPNVAPVKAIAPVQGIAEPSVNPDDDLPAVPPKTAPAGGARVPAAWAVDPANPPLRASPAHEAALKAHPERAPEFLQKFGYLPNGG